VFQGLVAPTLLPLSLPHRATGMHAAGPEVGDGGSGGVVLVPSCTEVEEGRGSSGDVIGASAERGGGLGESWEERERC
jgi:hypothetical protein